MADWFTHLYCANIVNESLKYEGMQKDMFLYGNIMPDINPGWIIEPDTRIEQPITHIEDGWKGQDYFWEPQRFYEKYKEEISANNPLYVGYMFHLWLDVTAMTAFVGRIPMSDMIMRGYDVRQWKWQDLENFSRNYPQKISTDYVAQVAEAASGIEEIKITENDLRKVASYLEYHATEDCNYGYHVFDEKSLVALWESACSDFVKWIGEATGRWL